MTPSRTNLTQSAGSFFCRMKLVWFTWLDPFNSQLTRANQAKGLVFEPWLEHDHWCCKLCDKTWSKWDFEISSNLSYNISSAIVDAASSLNKRAFYLKIPISCMLLGPNCNSNGIAPRNPWSWLLHAKDQLLNPFIICHISSPLLVDT